MGLYYYSYNNGIPYITFHGVSSNRLACGFKISEEIFEDSVII